LRKGKEGKESYYSKKKTGKKKKKVGELERKNILGL